LKPTDKVYIGDYILNVEPLEESSLSTAAAEELPQDEGYDEGGYEGDEAYAEDEQYEEEPPPQLPARGQPLGAAGPPPASRKNMPASMAAALQRNKRKVDPRIERYTRLQKEIHDRLIEYLDLRRMDMDRLGDEELWRRTEKAIRDIIEQMEVDGEIGRAHV